SSIQDRREPCVFEQCRPSICRRTSSAEFIDEPREAKLVQCRFDLDKAGNLDWSARIRRELIHDFPQLVYGKRSGLLKRRHLTGERLDGISETSYRSQGRKRVNTRRHVL